MSPRWSDRPEVNWLLMSSSPEHSGQIELATTTMVEGGLLPTIWMAMNWCWLVFAVQCYVDWKYQKGML